MFQAFPKAAGPLAHEDLIDILTQLILGNNRQRQGPNPKAEVIVAIRDVIRHAVANNKPIAFMVPWGSVKPDGTSLDVAELMTIRNFERIHNSVAEFYRPGVQFAIRLEDISMPWFQFKDEFVDKTKALAESAQYTRDFQNVVKVLGLENVVLVRPESAKVTIEEFSAAAAKVIPTMTESLRSYRDLNPMAAEAQLAGLGWKGGISFDMREYYLGLYRNLYPGASEDDRYDMMSRYFAAALVRNPLKLRGDLPEWEGQFVDFALAQPVPGTGGLFGKRVYRRAVSSRMSGRHVAPWRAKGYLSISEGDEISVKLRSFREAPLNLNYEVVTIKSDDGQCSVDIRADWVCE
jgi:hypothetical protein